MTINNSLRTAGRDAGPVLMSPRVRPASRLALLAIALLMLAACATAPKTDLVVERAQARWDALIAGDLETAYSYYSPGFRSTNSLIDFGVAMRLRKVQWTSAAYREHLCEGDRCVVTFDLGYRVRRPVPGLSVWNGKDVVEDTWVRTGGKWWYLPNK